MLLFVAFNKQKIEQLNKDFSTEEHFKYKELTENISQLKIKENQVLTDFEKFEEALTEVLTYIRTTPHNELESESEKENESAG